MENSKHTSIMSQQKKLKKYYKAKKKKEQKKYQNTYLSAEQEKRKKTTFLDRLFIRIFLGSLILLAVFGFDRIMISSKQTFQIREQFLTNINFMKYAKLFNGLFGTFIPIDQDITAFSPTVYDKVTYHDGINTVNNADFSGVINLTSGVVTKIQKTKDGLYNVTIQGVDDIIYTYFGMENIDCTIYSYVSENKIIGKAIKEENQYTFQLTLKKDGKLWNFYEIAED